MTFLRTTHKITLLYFPLLLSEVHSLPRFINSTLTGAEVSYEFLSNTLQSLFAQRKTLYSRRGDADLCRVNTLAVLHASSRWACSSSRVNPQGPDLTETRIKIRSPAFFWLRVNMAWNSKWIYWGEREPANIYGALRFLPEHCEVLQNKARLMNRSCFH